MKSNICIGCANCDPYMSSYGSFSGGDPRNFIPDPECSYEHERQLHAHHCQEWTKDNCVSVKTSGIEYVRGLSIKNANGDPITISPGMAFVERAIYGLGINRMTKNENNLFCNGKKVL